MNNYVLLTSAYNEEKNIGKTIESVLMQTIKPQKWYIVSDGSIDNTDYIIKAYAKNNSFIEYMRLDIEKKSGFSSKILALKTAYNQAAEHNIKYEYIGILDADISFEKEYFKKLIHELENDNQLGLCGGNIIQFVDGEYIKRYKNPDSVAGAVQFFKRKCFESTGGFLPMNNGGEDAAIEIKARMDGWKVKTIKELEVCHYGYVGDWAGSSARFRFKAGVISYNLGYHPIFFISRCVFKLLDKPVIIGSISELLGYYYSIIKYKRPFLDKETVLFLRNEQKDRLKKLLHLT